VTELWEDITYLLSYEITLRVRDVPTRSPWQMVVLSNDLCISQEK
jgi:hypothetical protein